jgi:signal peptidase I
MYKILNQTIKFILFFLIFFILFNFRVSYVIGNSMHPTLKNNTLIIIDKYFFKIFEIKRGDILVITLNKEEMIKRIAYLPGESFENEGKKITLEKNEIYLLGDNPKESIDSRDYGPVNTRNIIGKIFLSF